MGTIDDIEEKGGVNEPLLTTEADLGIEHERLAITSPSKGGLGTVPFILGIDGIQKGVNAAFLANMIVYLMEKYGLEMASGSNILFCWTAASNFSPILGAILADAYVGRFRMIGLGSFFSLMGMTLLWSTTMDTGEEMPSSTSPFQLILLCFSFGLMSIGIGGVTSSTASFGADQIVNNMTPNSNSGILESFFRWYLFSTFSSLIFSITVLVYIQDHMGWKIGFGVPLSLFLLSTIFFFLPSSIYVKAVPKPSLLSGFVQVLVGSWRNRHFQLSGKPIMYHTTEGSTLNSPTGKLRFFNKACIVKDTSEDIKPWKPCTVDQVEEFKLALNIIPIWSTGIIYAVILCQIPAQLLQANSMDRHFLSPSFEIPGGSIGTFGLIIAILWLALYDRVIIPLASKAMGKPATVSAKTRIGASLVLTTMAMVVAAIVETVRRHRASEGVELRFYPSMSVMWLVPQICLTGFAMAIGGSAQIELFYSGLPRSMSSIASSMSLLCSGIANLVASLIMSVIDKVTKRGGKESWVSGDVNKGHYDYYYWVLAALGFLNFIYYLFCSRAYGQGKKLPRDVNENCDEPLAL